MGSPIMEASTPGGPIAIPWAHPHGLESFARIMLRTQNAVADVSLGGGRATTSATTHAYSSRPPAHPLTRTLAHPPPPPPKCPHARSPTCSVAAFVTRQRGSRRRPAIWTRTGVDVAGGRGGRVPAGMLPTRHCCACLLGINSAGATAGARANTKPSSSPPWTRAALPRLPLPSLRDCGFPRSPLFGRAAGPCAPLRCECRTVPSVLGAAVAPSSALRSCPQCYLLQASPASLLSLQLPWR